MDLEREIRQFISDNYVLGQEGADLSGDDSLTQTGVIDSMGVLELIVFLDESYGVTVPDSEMTPENLDTIDSIVRYLKTKLALKENGHDGPSQPVA